MKTKVTSRLLAAMLAMLLAFGSTAAALADALVIPTSTYQELTQEAVDAYYARLMACETAAEMDAIAAELEQKNGIAFCNKLTEEQYYALECKFSELLAIEDAENMLTEETTDETEPPAEELEDSVLPDVEQQSGIVYETVDFTNAAPFKDPVIGSGSMQRMLTSRNSFTALAEDSDGLELNKTVSEPDENGVYTLTLEAWATGEKTITQQEKNIPTDIVLVLDQSGSMADSFTSTTYVKTSNTPAQLYENRDRLFVKIGNNQYSSVTVSRERGYTYTAFSGRPNSTYYDDDYRNSLYHQCSDGRYGKVTISRSNDDSWNRTYTYTCANGCTLGTSNGTNNVPSFNATLYRGQQNGEYTYTFSYEKADGTIETATVGADDSAPAWDFYLSQAGGRTTRLAALKSAVTTFANEVATKAKGEDGTLDTSDDVNHTIAIVGFANYSNYDNYNNTEVFIGGSQYKYGTAARNQYANAPQNMATNAGVNNITASIADLEAAGATYIDLGIEMANGILNANPIPAGETRNRVVIIFTDGVPGYSGNYSGASYDSTGGNAQAVANAAMTQIATTKNTYKATVYTVGIFTGADATSAGSNANNAEATERANYFMQRLSSNTSYPQTPSYYLSASDSSALTSIFKTISQNIEAGGTVVTLDEESVVKDVISDQFILPEGADASDIKVYSADYIDADTFADPVEFVDARIAISADEKTITVTNFDFSDNWVGTESSTVNGNTTTTYRGKKLIIEIPIVARDGFLGGNSVLTNADGSGIYEDSNAEEPIEEFVSPTVDVEIEPVVTVEDPVTNVYLYDDVTLAELDEVLKIRVGSVKLDLTAENYGLDSWQKAYVTLNDNEALTGYTDLTEDQTYTVTVTVTPTTEGTATTQTGTANGTINVFKPVVTFADSFIDYGTQNVAASYYDSTNYQSVEWLHGTDKADAESMGVAPTLSYIYAPLVNKWAPDGTVTELSDVAVNATASMTVNEASRDVTEFVTSKRKGCTVVGCTHTAETSGAMSAHNPEFVVHITNVVGDLKIVKLLKDSSFTTGTREFTFTIEAQNGQVNDSSKLSQKITLTATDENIETGEITVEDLIVGNYKITEAAVRDAAGNDLYKIDYSDDDQVVEVKVDNSAEITVTNTAIGTRDVVVEKVWVDEDNRYELRPKDDIGIDVQLQVDGTAVTKENVANFADAKLTAATGWTYTWEDVDKFDENGVAYDYSVVETQVANYGEPEYSNDVEDVLTQKEIITNNLLYTTLTITKSGLEDDDSAKFDVTVGKETYEIVMKDGSRTIKVPVGVTYAVSEDYTWVKRYKQVAAPENATGEFAKDTPVTVEFVNELADKWLTDEHSVVNKLEN